MVAALHAVAQAHRGHSAVLVAVPGDHRVGVGVVEHHAAGRGDLAYVAAEAFQRCDVALAVHDAAGAQRVADALVDAILERYLDVLLERLEHAYAHAVDDVVGALERLTAIERGVDLDVKAVGVDVALAQLIDHVQIVRVYVGKGHLDVVELGHGQYVREQLAREPYRTRADECDLYRHIARSFSV